MDAMPYEPRPNFGRPPVDPAKVQAVKELARAGASPKEAMEASGLSQGKVYEIYRIVRDAAQGKVD